MEPVEETHTVKFKAGDYLQMNVPQYDEIAFSNFNIQQPYRKVWEEHGLFGLVSQNTGASRRNNYSIASNCKTEKVIKLNVRLATPPPGQDCPPGVGSSYVFNLKPGDLVSALEPTGDFHIKAGQKEMVYIGGGAGMAPIRAHLADLFENDDTHRKVSYWYGARSKQELFYEDYFENLANTHENFDFHIALSAPLATDNWNGNQGFIHDVLYSKYLHNHTDLKNVEFYLCGPPMMIKACTKMLQELGVTKEQIAFDEF